tara:strand:- start:105 stop:212 length:108 start_codon:yes stop_codon:yes gene_type:complete
MLVVAVDLEVLMELVVLVAEVVQIKVAQVMLVLQI